MSYDKERLERQREEEEIRRNKELFDAMSALGSSMILFSNLTSNQKKFISLLGGTILAIVFRNDVGSIWINIGTTWTIFPFGLSYVVATVVVSVGLYICGYIVVNLFISFLLISLFVLIVSGIVWVGMNIFFHGNNRSNPPTQHIPSQVVPKK